MKDIGGFSLIESIVSTAILIIVAGSFCLFFCCFSKHNKIRSDFYSTIYSAENKMEHIRTADFDGITGDAITTVAEAEAGLKSIAVRIGSIELFTMRSKY